MFRIEPIKQLARHPLFMLGVVIVGFLIAFLSVFAIPRIESFPVDPHTYLVDFGNQIFLPMDQYYLNNDPFGSFIFKTIPIPYWFGISIIFCALFFMIPRLSEKRFKSILVFSSIMLMIAFRMVFPILFTTVGVPIGGTDRVGGYAPDTSNYDIQTNPGSRIPIGYMVTVENWVNYRFDFGVDGNYQHDFPLSFLVAFAFVKLGISTDLFFRVAPFFIYAFDAMFLYLIIKEIMPKNKKDSIIPALSVFLLSFSSLNYWITLHYSPNLFGTLMFFLSFYLVIRFAKSRDWSLKNLIPILVSLFLLILSHHLSTLYLIVTLFGFALSVWFFKPKLFKKGPLVFFLLAIYTYTLWFFYAEIVYPKFFQFYSLSTSGQSLVKSSLLAGLLPNLTFVIYPTLILVLFAIEFFRILQIRNPLSLLKGLREKLREIRVLGSDNNFLVFSAGFIFILLLFIVGLGIPNLFGQRIFEVLCIGLYPIASLQFIKLIEGSSSRKKLLMLAILLFVVLTGIYRYYNVIERIVILSNQPPAGSPIIG